MHHTSHPAHLAPFPIKQTARYHYLILGEGRLAEFVLDGHSAVCTRPALAMLRLPRPYVMRVPINVLFPCHVIFIAMG